MRRGVSADRRLSHPQAWTDSSNPTADDYWSFGEAVWPNGLSHGTLAIRTLWGTNRSPERGLSRGGSAREHSLPSLPDRARRRRGRLHLPHGPRGAGSGVRHGRRAGRVEVALPDGHDNIRCAGAHLGRRRQPTGLRRAPRRNADPTGDSNDLPAVGASGLVSRRDHDRVPRSAGRRGQQAFVVGLESGRTAK